MKVAAVQHDIVWQDPAATQRRLIPMIAQAAAAGARLIVLAEMYATGFSMDTELIAEEQGGPSEQFLISTAARHGVWLVVSLPQRWSATGRPRNTGLVVSPDGAVHRYAKRHLFSYGEEHKHYEPGESSLTVNVEGLSVSLFICYDLRFADKLWALAPQTDCYIVVANWPESRREHWRTLLAARAIENQAYVVGVNRVGADPKLTYAGDSRIIDPAGRVLAEASYGETVLTADVSAEEVKQLRQHFPFVADRL